MTQPSSPTPAARRTFFSRRFAPLIAAWLLALIVAALLFWIERSFPAFHEVIIPLYWIIAASTLIATWRWIRTRGKRERRRRDRRLGDRRSRSEPSPSTSSPLPGGDEV